MEQKLIGTTTVFFTDRCREKNKGILKLTHPAMLAEEETLRWLDSVHLDEVAANMDADLRTAAKCPVQRDCTAGEYCLENS